MIAALVFALATAAPTQDALPEVIRLRPPAATPAPTPETDAPQTQPEPQPEPEPQPALPPRASLAGEWSLSVTGRSTTCRMTLSTQIAEPGWSIAALGSNCPPSLFAVTRWRLSESELILATRSGRALARLTPKDSGWQGPGSDGRDAMMARPPLR